MKRERKININEQKTEKFNKTTKQKKDRIRISKNNKENEKKMGRIKQ